MSATYSTDHYTEFYKTGNQNLFEEIIDKMIISDLPEDFKLKINSLTLHKRRLSILSFLDKDRNLFMKIKSFISSEKISKVEHLKEVILMLRDYVKVGDVEKKKFGEVMTDLNLVKHILKRIPKESFSDLNSTFCDFANGTGVFPLVIIYMLMIGLKEKIIDPDLRYKHIIENQIFVSEIQPKNMFLYMCLVDPYDEYKLNIYTGSSLEQGFRDHMKNVWKKESFNYGVGNPPFNQMIDMKFVKLSYELCDVTCIVHPSTWLIDEKNKQRAFLTTKELVKDHLESIELFNGNKVFNITLAVPCCITYINKLKLSRVIRCFDRINDIKLDYLNIHQINKYSNITIYQSIKNKIFDYLKSTKKSLHSELKNNLTGVYYINISRISGHVYKNDDSKMVKDDFYTMVVKNLDIEYSPRMQSFGFSEYKAAKNFLEYVRSKFSRFCFSIYKSNKNSHRGELEIVPWLDFTQEWTDEKLYKEFNLTQEEIEFIEKNIPKYYE